MEKRSNIIKLNPVEWNKRKVKLGYSPSKYEIPKITLPVNLEFIVKKFLLELIPLNEFLKIFLELEKESFDINSPQYNLFQSNNFLKQQYENIKSFLKEREINQFRNSLFEIILKTSLDLFKKTQVLLLSLENKYSDSIEYRYLDILFESLREFIKDLQNTKIENESQNENRRRIILDFSTNLSNILVFSEDSTK